MMPFDPLTMASTFTVAITIPLTAHMMRTIRREAEDLYDYIRLKKGLEINYHRHKQRKRRFKKKQYKVHNQGMEDIRPVCRAIFHGSSIKFRNSLADDLDYLNHPGLEPQNKDSYEWRQ